MSVLAEQMVLKEGDVFLVSHDNGDVSGNTGLGLYYHDMRYLSHLTLQMNGQALSLLDSSGSQNFMGVLQLANEVFTLPNDIVVLPQTIGVRRSRFISEGLHERIELANYNRFPVPVAISLRFGSDFRDIFDVRGFPREKWGELLPPLWHDGGLQLRYNGLDGVLRSTAISFDRPPDRVETLAPASTEVHFEQGIMVPVVGAPSYHITIEPHLGMATWNLVLQPNAPVSIALHVMPHEHEGLSSPEEAWELSAAGLASPGPAGRYDRAVHSMRESYRTWAAESTVFRTDNEGFNALIMRSENDLRVLCGVEDGAYFPSAGIPWFACPFGRDSIVTALQTLSLNPRIAIGTLRVLARYQGVREDPWREEQPGKILHEMRRGEMARIKLVPHSPYYGAVDATPLFVMLFVETMKWLDDDALYEELLPNVMRAIEWIDRYGDVDGDGFVEYVASTSNAGIRNQVWKDSGDSTQFPDGTLAETPVAAAEVQGYVYAARKGLAELLRRKGDTQSADRLAAEAETLRQRFNDVFWMGNEGFFAQALDRDKRQVPTITTNPGHALWCGIAGEEKARLTAARMMEPDMLSGWGMRTISDLSPSYNPMSYHNGSVWPHDNSIASAGLKRYGCYDEANRVITQVAEAAGHFRYRRLPELYCGFPRDTLHGAGPAEYPVSCNPQAWAAAAPILMTQTLLGLQVDASRNIVRTNPRLPDWLSYVQVRNLRIGSKNINLSIRRQHGQHETSMDETAGSGIVQETT
ncbi:MAG: amylo-alpha-1,6-glucosidase [Chloroflexota bacterium]|nr:amylo-alpha-1,6-glucosidase [Chloroflexota bacterium]